MKMTALVSLLVAILASAQVAFAEAYKVDPVHSSIVFRIGHLNVSHVYGRFNGATGTIDFDPAAGEKTSLNVQVESKSVDTAVPQRDQHLRSADFFDVEKYPVISFKSTSVRPAGQETFEVTGDLTLNGVTKPVTVSLKHTGTGQDPQGKTRIGFETELTINRTEFGMKPFPGVADEVKLMIALEAIKQ